MAPSAVSRNDWVSAAFLSETMLDFSSLASLSETANPDASSLAELILRPEETLRRRHGVIRGQEELEVKLAALVRRALGSVQDDVKVAKIRFAHAHGDSGNRFLL